VAETSWALVGADEEIVAGRHPVEEAFAARREARRLLVVPQRREALEALVLHATRLRIPVVEVEGGTLTAVAGFDGHQGVALVVAPRRWASLDEVLARAATRSEPPFVLVLDSLEDPQNLGTLLRSADACGVHGVIFPTRNAAPLTPSAVKASAGAVEHLLLVPVDDLPGALVDLRTRGLHLVGTDAGAALAYRDADLRGPVALVIGSEGKGMTGPVRRRLELLVRIPMRGHVGSLNAAVAGSVLLFEAAAQRLATAGLDSEPGERDPGRPGLASPGSEAVNEAATQAVPGAPVNEAAAGPHPAAEAVPGTPVNEAAAGPHPAAEAGPAEPERRKRGAALPKARPATTRARVSRPRRGAGTADTEGPTETDAAPAPAGSPAEPGADLPARETGERSGPEGDLLPDR
jgi:23S rRNA (guanosine2251-2'-O)-methyltransferase